MDFPFTTDGCSVVADLHRYLCIEHDWAYWMGDAGGTRKEADARFRDQLISLGGWWRVGGWVRWFGVRIGGASWVPATKWRWGYGWEYPGCGRGRSLNEGRYTFATEWPKYQEALRLAQEKEWGR